MSRVRRDLALILPGGFVVLSALLLFRPGVAPEAVRPYIHVCAVVVLLLGVLLGWHHRRSAVVFGFVLLSVSGTALWWLARHELAAGAAGRAVIGVLAVLLPLNLAAYSALPELAVTTTRALVRLLPILAQLAAGGVIVRVGAPALTEWLDRRWLDGHWTDWTAVPQLGVAAFAGAMLFVAFRYLSQRDPIAVGFLWALSAAFLALHGIARGWDPVAFIATGGWILVGSLLEATCRWATHDRVTELPERDALNKLLHRLSSPHFLALVRVDHFARIRSVFGREVSDQVLRMVAAQLQRTPGETVFRYGKDEFAVLFEGMSAAQAVPHLEHVRRMVASYGFVVRGPGRRRSEPAAAARPAGPRVVLNVTVSIGAAQRESHRVRPRHVIRAAHEALRLAIEGGRNQVIA